MKFGRALVRGFTGKRKARPVRRAPPSRRPRAGLGLWKAPDSVPSAEPMSVQAEKVIESAVELPSVTPVAPKPSAGMLSADFVRPNDRLRGAIESFLLDQRSPHTRRAYGKDLKRFVAYLLGRRVRSGDAFAMERIDRATIIGYKDMLLGEGLEHTTVDRHLATLRSFFRWLVEENVLEKNPAENVRFLNPKRVSRTNGFSDDEVMKILRRPNLHTRTGAQHYAILMVLFYCGLRRSELCELRTSGYGRERGHRVFRLRGKGNAERVIAVIPAVEKALDYYFHISRRDPAVDAPLFSAIRNNRGAGIAKRAGATTAGAAKIAREKPLDPSMIFYVVTKYAREAGIANRVSPHSCRATAISNARDHDVPDRVIQEFAGWANPDMITRYDKRKASVEDSAAHAIRYGKGERSFPAIDPEPRSTVTRPN